MPASHATTPPAFGLMVTFRVSEGHLEAFDALVARTIDRIRADEPDTLLYMVHSVVDEPLTRLFYELYRDEDAFRFHESQDYVRSFLAAREAHLDGVEVSVLSVQEGVGPSTNIRDA